MGRMMLVVAVFLAFLGGITALLCFRLITPMGLRSPWNAVGVSVVVALVLFMVGSMFAFRLQQSSTGSAQGLMLVQEAGYLVMGFLAFVLTVLLVRDALALLLRGADHWIGLGPWVQERLFSPAGYRVQTVGVLLLAAGLSVWAMYLCFHPVVNRLELRYPKLAPALSGLRIVMISDIHVGPWFRRSFVERIVGMAQSEHPDLVILAGDVADGLPGPLTRDAAPLGELKGRLGNFYVTGNHEYYWNAPAWVAHMRSLGYVPLQNESKDISVAPSNQGRSPGPSPTAAVKIVGVADFQSLSFPGEGKTDFKAAFRGVKPGETFCLAIVHQPKGADMAASLGADLVLSGHTHGGQFPPGTLVIRWAQKYVAGLYRIGESFLYVGRGTGAWGPPMRLGARGEVVVLTLNP